MAAVDTTFQSYQAKGLREDLSNMIYDISPTETPFMSNIGRGTAKASFHEWQTDALDAAVSTNQQIEGDDITQFTTVTPSVRVGNYTNTSWKHFAISATMEAVDKAGRNSEIAYQLAKRGKEIRRDMEKAMLENIAASAGNATTARVSAGMGAWIKTNDSVPSGSGASPTYTNVPNDDRTDATAGDTRDITEALFKGVMTLVYNSGGDLKMVMAGPVNKQNISGFDGIATRFTNTGTTGQTSIIGAADVYVGDFGTVSIVPNRFQRERDVWFIDPSMASVDYLIPFKTETLAKTGLAEKRVLHAEWTLRVNNEAAHGLLADLKTTVL